MAEELQFKHGRGSSCNRLRLTLQRRELSLQRNGYVLIRLMFLSGTRSQVTPPLYSGQLSCKRRNVRLGLRLGAVGLDCCIYVRLQLEDGCGERLAFREHAMFEEHERHFRVPRRVSHRGELFGI